MKGLIDTIFNPVLNWLNSILSSIMSLDVPFSHPLDIAKYLGPFSYLGNNWISFIVTCAFLAFIYVVTYIIVSQQGLFSKFKDMVKWW